MTHSPTRCLQDGADGAEEDGEPAAPVYQDKKKTRADDPNFKSAEALRKQRQDEMLRKKNEETLRRLTAQSAGARLHAEMLVDDR